MIKHFLLSAILMCVGVSATFANVKRADELLTAAYGKGEFSGVVSIERGGKPIYQRAIGQAERNFGIPNSLSTKFRICSVTKQFTAMLVMQLVEAGKLDLDKPVSQYLPEFRKETGSKVTVRSLLLSSSGLPVLPDEFYVSEDPKMADANFVIGKYLQGDLAFEPGSKFNYNNGDFIILGEIVARLSGEPYAHVLGRKILDPLGMKNTGLLGNEDIIANLAGGYSYKDGAFINESFVRIQNFGAAGAMYSTAGDLHLWDRALISNKLLSKKLTEEMFAPSKALGFVALGSWAYDLKLSNGKSVRVVERQGYINGFCALNIILPNENTSALFLSNLETQTLFQTYANQGLSYTILDAVLSK